MNTPTIDFEMRQRWHNGMHEILCWFFEFAHTQTANSRERLAKRFGLIVTSQYSKDRRGDIFAASHAFMTMMRALIEGKPLDDVSVKTSLAKMASHKFPMTVDVSNIGTLND
jgi:hypothetical protein